MNDFAYEKALLVKYTKWLKSLDIYYPYGTTEVDLFLKKLEKEQHEKAN